MKARRSRRWTASPDVHTALIDQHRFTSLDLFSRATSNRKPKSRRITVLHNHGLLSCTSHDHALLLVHLLAVETHLLERLRSLLRWYRSRSSCWLRLRRIGQRCRCRSRWRQGLRHGCRSLRWCRRIRRSARRYPRFTKCTRGDLAPNSTWSGRRAHGRWMRARTPATDWPCIFQPDRNTHASAMQRRVRRLRSCTQRRRRAQL